MKAQSLTHRLREALVPVVGALVVRALGATWRVQVTGGEHLEALRRAQAPFVFILWHGELLPLLWVHRDEGVHILVSEHRDGELIARAARRLGYQLVRGSTTRGGARALLQVAALLREGREVAVTPDGPRGPRHTFAPGATVAAQRADAPLLCIRASASAAWRMRSWDAFMIPKPFAVLRVAYAPAARVEAPDTAGAEGEAARFQAMLQRTGDAIGA